MTVTIDRKRHVRARTAGAMLFAMMGMFSGVAASAMAAERGAQTAGTTSGRSVPGRVGFGPMMPPVSPACISSPFGPRILPDKPLAGTFHYGIDLPAPEGAPVHAVAPGTVIRVQRHGPGGLEMLVQHDGYVSLYSHLGMIAPMIAEGRRTVFGGQKIGTVGRTGVTYGMHLYFGLLVDGRPVDPAGYLGVGPCGAGGSQGRFIDSRVSPTRRYFGG